MNAISTRSYIAILSIIMILVFSFTTIAQEKQMQEAPTIEGTYKLVKRVLSDGTTATDAMGLLTYTKTHRNFNVIWKNKDGKFFSYSLVSTYKLTPTEYSETKIFSIMNDQIGGKEIQYDLSAPSETVPVTMEDGKIMFELPFDPVSVTLDGNKVIAKNPDFTDYWEKVQ